MFEYSQNRERDTKKHSTCVEVDNNPSMFALSNIINTKRPSEDFVFQLQRPAESQSVENYNEHVGQHHGNR